MNLAEHPVTWRWRALGATIWIYNPEPEWLEQHRHDIECEPLYHALVAERVRNETIEECALALRTQESSYLTASEAAEIVLALKEKT